MDKKMIAILAIVSIIAIISVFLLTNEDDNQTNEDSPEGYVIGDFVDISVREEIGTSVNSSSYKITILEFVDEDALFLIENGSQKTVLKKTVGDYFDFFYLNNGKYSNITKTGSDIFKVNNVDLELFRYSCNTPDGELLTVWASEDDGLIYFIKINMDEKETIVSVTGTSLNGSEDLEDTSEFEGCIREVSVKDSNGKPVSGGKFSIYLNNASENYSCYSFSGSVSGLIYTLIPKDLDYYAEYYLSPYSVYNYKEVPSEIIVPVINVGGIITVGDNIFWPDGSNIIFYEQGTSDVIDSNVSVFNGHFEINSIIPNYYDYKIRDSNNNLVHSGSIKFDTDGKLDYEISIPCQEISINVTDSTLKPIKEGILNAIEESSGFEFKGPIFDGLVVLYVIPGIYSISVDDYAMISNKSIEINGEAREFTLSVFDCKLITITGNKGAELTISGGDYTTKSFNDGTRFSIPYNISTDAQIYTLYGVANGKVYTGIYSGGSTAKVLETDYVTVSGTLKDGNSTTSGTIKFIDEHHATYITTASMDGRFLLKLPAGHYTVVADNNNDKIFINKGYINGDLGNLDLVDGRKISVGLRCDPQLAYQSYIRLPYTLGIIEFEYNNECYNLYSMSDCDGCIESFVPDGVNINVHFNNLDGTLLNSNFSCCDLNYSFDAGKSNNSVLITIRAGIDGGDNHINGTWVVSEFFDPKYETVMTLYADQSVVYDFTTFVPSTLLPGTYELLMKDDVGCLYREYVDIHIGSHELIKTPPGF